MPTNWSNIHYFTQKENNAEPKVKAIWRISHYPSHCVNIQIRAELFDHVQCQIHHLPLQTAACFPFIAIFPRRDLWGRATAQWLANSGTAIHIAGNLALNWRSGSPKIEREGGVKRSRAEESNGNITKIHSAYQRRSISHDFLLGIERRLYRLSSSNLSSFGKNSSRRSRSVASCCCFHQFMQLPFKVRNYGWHFVFVRFLSLYPVLVEQKGVLGSLEAHSYLHIRKSFTNSNGLTMSLIRRTYKREGKKIIV